jgi:hypothetical protein
MHIILLPAYVHRPLKRLLILSPSIIIVLLTVTFRLLDNVFFYSSNSQFSNTKLRLKACSDIINGTFVCQLSPRSTFTFRDAEGICQLVSLAVIVGYAVAAKNVLGGYGYYEYLEVRMEWTNEKRQNEGGSKDITVLKTETDGDDRFERRCSGAVLRRQILSRF